MLDLKQEFRANHQDPASTQRPSRDEPWPLHTKIQVYGLHKSGQMGTESSRL